MAKHGGHFKLTSVDDDTVTCFVAAME